MSECAGKEAGKEKKSKAVREVLGRIKNRAREKRGKKRIHSLSSSLSFMEEEGKKEIAPNSKSLLTGMSLFRPTPFFIHNIFGQKCSCSSYQKKPIARVCVVPG